MPIDALCPKCSSSLTVPDEFAGKMIRCGGCSDTFVVSLPPPLPASLQSQPPALPSQTNSETASTTTASKPAERPVARAIPVSKTEQRPSESSSAKAEPISRRPDVSRARQDDAPPKSSLGMGLMIMVGVLLFICSGLGVVGYSIWKLSSSDDKPIADAVVSKPRPPIKEAPQLKEVSTKTTDKTQPADSKNPFVPVKNNPTPPTVPTVEPPSPVGMQDLVMYSSFDTNTIRDEISREKLEVDGLPGSLVGKRKKAARFLCRPSQENLPEFAVDLTPFVSNFQMKDNTAWTIAMWVAVPSSDAQEQTVFSLCQSSSESAPQLNIRVMKNRIEVQLNCDKKDSEKSFIRGKNINVKELLHVAISRSTQGKLSVYFNGEEETTVPNGSLSADQPVAMSFKYAGFGKRSEKNFVLIVDEFAYFQRELLASEIKKIAGR